VGGERNKNQKKLEIRVKVGKKKEGGSKPTGRRAIWSIPETLQNKKTYSLHANHRKMDMVRIRERWQKS